MSAEDGWGGGSSRSVRSSRTDRAEPFVVRGRTGQLVETGALPWSGLAHRPTEGAGGTVGHGRDRLLGPRTIRTGHERVYL